MENQIKTHREDWDIIENIAIEFVEDEMELLSPSELEAIKSNIESGNSFTEESHNGMAFNFGEAITLVSIALTVISWIKDYYVYTRKPQISADDVLSWIMERDGAIPITIPVKQKSTIEQFIREHIDEISERVVE